LLWIIFFKELFRGGHEKYYQEGDGFILVYSVESKKTIEYLMNIKNDILFSRKSYVG
jgi:hypothetical protein